MKFISLFVFWAVGLFFIPICLNVNNCTDIGIVPFSMTYQLAWLGWGAFACLPLFGIVFDMIREG